VAPLHGAIPSNTKALSKGVLAILDPLLHLPPHESRKPGKCRHNHGDSGPTECLGKPSMGGMLITDHMMME
jgi:hypothetical protein